MKSVSLQSQIKAVYMAIDRLKPNPPKQSENERFLQERHLYAVIHTLRDEEDRRASHNAEPFLP